MAMLRIRGTSTAGCGGIATTAVSGHATQRERVVRTVGGPLSGTDLNATPPGGPRARRSYRARPTAVGLDQMGLLRIADRHDTASKAVYAEMS
eukprot:4939463-Prymnesium_polylepis.1